MPPTEREYGMGAVQSPVDPRDYPISELLAAVGFEAAAWVPPASYRIPAPPPVTDQGNSPQCVAYSHAAMKAWQDRQDDGRIYDFDESAFFALIGGSDSGAIARNALERMRLYGYPVQTTGHAERHKIAAYYAVPKAVLEVKQAIAAFGAVTILGPWYHNWIYGLPGSAILPWPDYGGNGHAVLGIGWDDARNSFEFQNSWGTAWANGGRAWMPYSFVVNTMWEIWKAVDVLTAPPPGGNDLPDRLYFPDPPIMATITPARSIVQGDPRFGAPALLPGSEATVGPYPIRLITDAGEAYPTAEGPDSRRWGGYKVVTKKGDRFSGYVAWVPMQNTDPV